MLSRLVITFLPRSKCLLISWLQSPSAVILEPKKLKWLSGKQSDCRCRSHRRHGFHPWAGKIPWRRKWQPTPVFLPGESHGQRSLVGGSPWGHKESDTSERLNTLSSPGGQQDTWEQDSLFSYLCCLHNSAQCLPKRVGFYQQLKTTERSPSVCMEQAGRREMVVCPFFLPPGPRKPRPQWPQARGSQQP